MSTKVQLEIFEGPLDLLLHLIKKNEVSITEIPIASITEQYLATIDLMQSFNLDVAGEFLVMAATLIHIKSRMLLPPGEEEGEEDEEGDPREELVRRLLDYQRYKEAAEQLEKREILTRDVFTRAALPDEGAEPAGFAQVSVFQLLTALRQVLDRLPADTFHEVTLDKISVRDKMNGLLDVLRGGGRVVFQSLFADAKSRLEVVVTFLAMLELVKMRAVRIVQEEQAGPIVIELAAAFEEAQEAVSGVEDGEEHHGA